MAALFADSYRSPAALTRFLLVAVVGVVVDLWTKAWAFRELCHGLAVENGRVKPVGEDELAYAFLPGWLHFKVTTNYGAVFGIGQGQRWLFLGVSVAAILFLVYLFASSNRRQWFYQVVLGMLLAGVLGNMYDRWTFGYVRDMIYALPGRTWPGSTREVFPWIFNVADTLLCVGVGLMLVYSLFAPQPTRDGTSGEDVSEDGAETADS